MGLAVVSWAIWNYRNRAAIEFKLPKTHFVISWMVHAVLGKFAEDGGPRGAKARAGDDEEQCQVSYKDMCCSTMVLRDSIRLMVEEC